MILPNLFTDVPNPHLLSVEHFKSNGCLDGAPQGTLMTINRGPFGLGCLSEALFIRPQGPPGWGLPQPGRAARKTRRSDGARSLPSAKSRLPGTV